MFCVWKRCLATIVKCKPISSERVDFSQCSVGFEHTEHTPEKKKSYVCKKKKTQKPSPFVLGAGTAAAAGTSIARQLTRDEIRNVAHSNDKTWMSSVVFHVTIFLCHDRVSCGPGAFSVQW